MCRLFGLTGGRRGVRATFWLLDAPDSLDDQSRRQPDGYGLGTFGEDGSPEVDKAPMAAWRDARFACEARNEVSRTFLAHLRYATTGAPAPENTHPFEQHGRLFAHNGVFEELDRLDEHLGEHRALVRGDTDSERLFALITRETEGRDGDLEAGIRAAVGWVASELPVFAINFVLTTATDLWAFRYPEAHELWTLQCAPCPAPRDLVAVRNPDRLRVRSEELATAPAAVVASERMTDEADWRLLGSGELLHVDADLRTRSVEVLTEPPARPITLADLSHTSAAAQQH